jgi:hypothetical protein
MVQAIKELDTKYKTQIDDLQQQVNELKAQLLIA